jgi:hypothetical protein
MKKNEETTPTKNTEQNQYKEKIILKIINNLSGQQQRNSVNQTAKPKGATCKQTSQQSSKRIKSKTKKTEYKAHEYTRIYQIFAYSFSCAAFLVCWLEYIHREKTGNTRRRDRK